MKKLNKLQIDSEKLMKNNELVNLRGGYDGEASCTCLCKDIQWYLILGYLVSSTGDCSSDCKYAFGNSLYIGGTCVS
jgi:hypothetical protein